MIELDTRRKELERALSASPAPDPIRIHPSMARTHRTRIGQLIAGLSEAERMDVAKEALRALIKKIEMVPISADEAEDGSREQAEAVRVSYPWIRSAAASRTWPMHSAAATGYSLPSTFPTGRVWSNRKGRVSGRTSGSRRARTMA